MDNIDFIGGALLGVLAIAVASYLALYMLPFIVLFIVGFTLIKVKDFFNK